MLGVGLVLEGAAAVATTSDLGSSVLRWFEDLRTSGLTDVAKALAWLSSASVVLTLRILTVIACAVFKRWRHLVVFLAMFVLADWAAARLLYVHRPPPTGVTTIGEASDFVFPSLAITSLAVTLFGMAASQAPAGSARRTSRFAATLISLASALAIAYLGQDYLADVVYPVLLAYVGVPLVFGYSAPDEVFPVTYHRGGVAAHLDLSGARAEAVKRAMADQLGLVVTKIEPFGLAGSGGSSPLRATLEDGSRVFGKIYATSHVRADRWYRIGRTIMYGTLEDERPIGSVRRMAEYEDYALLLLANAGIRVAKTYGVVELTPEREYMLVTEFFEHAKNLGDSKIDEAIVDEGIELIRRFWDVGVAHRDVKPANLLVKDDHLQLVDVSGLEVRPTSWRQAVDLANMLLTLSLQSDPDLVYRRAKEVFTPEEISEALACDVGMAIPTELQSRLKQDPRPLMARLKELAPAAPRVSIQRWSLQRLVLTAAALGGALLLLVLFVNTLTAGL